MGNPQRLFVIGDIHGCLNKLQLLFEKIDPRPDIDQLVFLGDYIDRGENSIGVLEYLIQLRETYRDTVFLMGNHEKMFADFLAGVDRELFVYNGGDATLMNYIQKMGNPWSEGKKVSDEEALGRLVPKNHRDFLDDLRLYYETDGYIMVHAGLKQGICIEDQSVEDLVWIREEFILSEEDFGKRIVFGHTPFAEPLILPNKIGIDTGAVYGNALTCVILPDLEFVSV